MKIAKTAAVVLVVLAAARVSGAQDAGIHVRAIRVLASNPEALATFYEKAFGMSETRRAANSATFKEIVINSGATTELAQKAPGATIVITTRPADSPATNNASLPSLILNVPDIQKAVDSVKANGGTVTRTPTKSGADLMYSFVKDPDGNLVELVMSLSNGR
jgi:predicted enzyme related to lactoylglutathione lyase